MHRFATWTLIWAGVLAGCAPSGAYRGRVLLEPTAGGERFDALGDRLPAGAIARLGTGRFRHANSIRQIAYSPDGETIASWGGDMRCRFWDAASGRLLLATPAWYRMPTFSPDGRHVALCYGTDIHMVRISSGKVVQWLRNHKREITWAGFSADGGRLVTISNDRTVRVWSVLLGIQVRKIELGRFYAQSLNVAAMTPDARLLAVVTGYSSAQLVDLDRGRCLRRLETPSSAWVNSLAFSPDGQTLWGKVHDSKTLFWDTRTGQICTGAAPIHRPGPFAVSPDRRTVAYASGDRIRLEDVRTGKELPLTARMPGHDRAPTMMSLRPDGGTLISAAGDDIRQWDVKTGRDRLMLGAPDDRGQKWIALSPDGRWAASQIDSGGLVGVYDVAAGRRVALIEGGADEKITGVAFAGDSRTIVTSSRDAIRLWNIPAGTLKQAIGLSGKDYLSVTSPAMTGDGNTLVAAVSQPNPRLNNNDRLKARSMIVPREVRHIEVFDVPTGRSRGRIPGTLFALAPNSHTLAKPGYKCVELWDLATIERGASLEAPDDLLSCGVAATIRLRFSPDGRKLARAFAAQVKDGKWSLGGNGCIELFDLVEGGSRNLKVDDVSAAPVAAFSADSRTLAAGGANGGILLWDISKPAKGAAAP